MKCPRPESCMGCPDGTALVECWWCLPAWRFCRECYTHHTGRAPS